MWTRLCAAKPHKTSSARHARECTACIIGYGDPSRETFPDLVTVAVAESVIFVLNFFCH
jgi:hypothetical protein